MRFPAENRVITPYIPGFVLSFIPLSLDLFMSLHFQPSFLNSSDIFQNPLTFMKLLDELTLGSIVLHWMNHTRSMNFDELIFSHIDHPISKLASPDLINHLYICS